MKQKNVWRVEVWHMDGRHAIEYHASNIAGKIVLGYLDEGSLTRATIISEQQAQQEQAKATAQAPVSDFDLERSWSKQKAGNKQS